MFFEGPNIPGGSCSLSDQVTPLSYECFMHPLHLDFIETTTQDKEDVPAVHSISEKDFRKTHTSSLNNSLWKKKGKCITSTDLD